MRGRLAALAILLVWSPPAGASEPPASVVAATESQRLDLSLQGGLAVRWEVCHPVCDASTHRVTFNELGDLPQARLVVAGDPGLSERLDRLDYRVERHQREGDVLIELASEPLAAGVHVEKTWRIAAKGYRVWLEVAVRGDSADEFARAHPLGLELVVGRSFRPPPAAGFAGLSDTVWPVYLDADGVDDPREQPDAISLGRGSWAGVRNRFWALLARGESAGSLRASGRDGVSLQPAPSSTLHFEFYAGPIQHAALEAVDPALTGLLFSGLWFWMRWLSLGMLFLLDAIQRGVGNAGLAIALLALSVKILMRPLTSLAERWQREVNAVRSRLQPHIDEVKRLYRGEEKSRRLLALHRQHSVSPFFGLKSLFGVLIQIPIFFAAYHTLEDDFALRGVGLLWIQDLTLPDRLASLPFSLPFFGDAVNLLPFLMAAITIVSARLHDDGSLARDLLRKQRRSLYWMAGAFFVLLYSFPAGMVLYWTSNNVVLLAGDRLAGWLSGRRRQRRLELDGQSPRV